MNESSDMCCLCLNVTNNPFTELFSKIGNGLTHHDKISSSLFRLANVLNENSNYNLKLCNKCCDTIDMVYQFHESCLNNFGMYLSNKKVVKVETEQEQYNPTFESNSDNHSPINEKLFIKQEPFIQTEQFSSNSQSNEYIIESSNVLENVFVKQEIEEVSCIPDTCEFDERIEEKIKIDEHEISITFNNCSSEDITIEKLNSHNEPTRADVLTITEKNSHDTHENNELNKQLQPSGLNTAKKNKSGFECGECGKKFHLKGNLKNHMRSHSNEKNFKCNICEKSFKHSFDLKKHMIIHNGNRPFICDICKLAFRHKYALTSHIKTKHELNISENKPYPCNQCEKQFTSKGNLDVHKRIHSGERPYGCEVCKKAFSTNSALNRHKRIHTGEKPYSCDICAKSFNDISTLYKHKFTHKD